MGLRDAVEEDDVVTDEEPLCVTLIFVIVSDKGVWGPEYTHRTLPAVHVVRL